jgi:hypothetical protein
MAWRVLFFGLASALTWVTLGLASALPSVTLSVDSQSLDLLKVIFNGEDWGVWWLRAAIVGLPVVLLIAVVIDSLRRERFPWTHWLGLVVFFALQMGLIVAVLAIRAALG